MRATTKMTSKGQVTIPAKIRKRFGLRTGDTIIFLEQDGVLNVLSQSSVSVFEQWRGIGNSGLPNGREELLQYFHDMRGHDDFDRQ